MFEINEKYLPWCSRRYKVNQYGKVLNNDGTIIENYELDGQLYVNIDWVFGRYSYLVSLLILVGFEKVKLPCHLLQEVEPLYIDGNKSNLTPNNLIYRYKDGPLPAEGFEGYYHIPLYNDYAINKDGDIVNVYTGKNKVWSITKTGGPKNQTGGYYYNRVLNDAGFSRVLFLHRALCMVFKPYGNNVLSLVVNHLDGKPSNNALGNLEWTTYRLNNIHAYQTGLRPNASSPILMKDLKTGNILKFSSISACAKHLNNPSGSFISYRLINSPTKVFEDMLLFKYDDNKPWPIVDLNKIEICRLGLGSDIIARNVFTGELFSFTGTASGEKITNVNRATILRHLRENSNIPFNGYNFRYLENAKEWPKHSARHLKIYEKYPHYPPDGVLVYDKETETETFFTSAAEASNTFGLRKNFIRNLITNKSLLKNRYSFSYFKIRDAFRSAITAM